MSQKKRRKNQRNRRIYRPLKLKRKAKKPKRERTLKLPVQLRRKAPPQRTKQNQRLAKKQRNTKNQKGNEVLKTKFKKASPCGLPQGEAFRYLYRIFSASRYRLCSRCFQLGYQSPSGIGKPIDGAAKRN